MKKLLLLILLAFSITVNAQQISGTQITSSIVPNDLQDNYATHVDTFGFGGYRVIPTITARDAIKSSRKIEGMLVYVTADDKIYKLETLPNTWIEFSSGSGASQWQDITGGIEYPSGNVTVNDTLLVNGDIIANSMTLSSEDKDTTYYVNGTLGSDITGDGTQGNPFQTLEKTVLNVKPVFINSIVTISLLGSNTYVFNDIVSRKISAIKGTGRLILLGEEDTLYTDVAATVIGDDPTLYNLTVGGATPTWAPDELVGKYMTRSVFRGYIINNGASDAYIASRVITGTIVDYMCTIEFESSATDDYFIRSSIALDFMYLKINMSTLNLGTYGDIIWDCSDLTLAVDYNSGTKNTIINSTLGKCQIRSTRFFNSRGAIYINSVQTGLIGTYFDGIGDVVFMNGINTLGYNVFRASNLTMNYNHQVINNYYNRWLKFKDCDQALEVTAGGFYNYPNGKIILDNVTDFIDFGAVMPNNFWIDIHPNTIIGEPTNLWLKDSPGYLAKGNSYYINIEGILFPEYTLATNSNLTNNSTTNIVIGDKTQNRSIDVNYTAYRNGKIEQGIVQIFHDGTTLYINRTSHDNQSGNGIGLSINTKFDTTNTDLINIELIVDDNVDAVTFDYSITRKLL